MWTIWSMSWDSFLTESGWKSQCPTEEKWQYQSKSMSLQKKKKILGNSQKSFPIQKLSVFSVNYLDPEE